MKIYLKKKILGIGIILGLIFVAINLYNNYNNQKGTFDEIILNEFKEDKFHKVIIDDVNPEYDENYKRSEKTEDVNKLLSLFKDLEVRKVDNHSLREKYSISLSNYNTYESLYIAVLNEKYLYIAINTIKIKEDKDNNVSKYVSDFESNYYEIINGELDIEVIEKFFNDIDVSE